jgi:serine/threonine protein kinase
MNTSDKSLCPGCFKMKEPEALCPHCGYDESAPRGPLILPHHTLLQGQYRIGRVLGKPGGFGITYLALDTRLETCVAIKEYLPRNLAGRETGKITVSAHSIDDQELFRYGLEQFLHEARTLAKFNHANLVRIRHVFEENGTAYLVMDYYEGMTLAEHLYRKGKLPEQAALDILLPILDGLREVHAKGLVHRDINPRNIYLTTQNHPILLDFGAARLAVAEHSQSLTVILTPGYAPFEQYHRKGELGPWTDIYACAALLYQMVTGKVPPEALERAGDETLALPRSLVPTLSSRLSEAILQGMAMDFHKRPQTVEAFRNSLLVDSAATIEPGPATVRVDVDQEAGNGRGSIRKKSGLLILVFIGLMLSAEVYFMHSSDSIEARKDLQRIGIEYTEQQFAISAGAGDMAAVRLFLDAGMDVNAGGGAALGLAAGRGRIDMVKLLLSKGAKPTSNALQFARTRGHTEIERLLVEAGATE